MEVLFNDLNEFVGWLGLPGILIVITLIVWINKKNKEKKEEAEEKKRKSEERRKKKENTITIKETKTTKVHNPKKD